MSMGNSAENALLLLIFNATTWAELAENDSSSPCTNITVALHTATPDETGTQSTSECAYTGYLRVNVARTAGGWTITGNSVSPVANIDFGECTASPGGPATHFSVGTGTANFMIGYGTLTPNITIAAGTIPRIKTTTTLTMD